MMGRHIKFIAFANLFAFFILSCSGEQNVSTNSYVDIQKKNYETDEVEKVEDASRLLERNEIESITKQYLKAKLPATLYSLRGRKESLFTMVINIKFITNKNDLNKFLKSSPILPNSLVKEQKSVNNKMGFSNSNWWKPDRLVEFSGYSDVITTRNGKSIIGIDIISGKEESYSEQIVVYMSLTVEAN